MASGLLFVPALHVGAAADGLAIRDFRRLQNHFGVIALLQFCDHDLDVLLPRAGDQKFLGLRVAEEAQHEIFFHQLVDAVGELVFIGARLGLDGKSNGRLGQLQVGILNRAALVSQRIAGERFPQLGDHADVAGVQLGHLDRRLALNHGKMRKFLRRTAGEILQRGFVSNHAGENFEEGDAPGKGIVRCFENV